MNTETKNQLIRNIWVTNYYDQNIDSCRDHLHPKGSIQYLVEGRINIFDTDYLIKMIERKLRQYKPEDALLLIGNIVINSLAVTAVVRKFGSARLLIYNANDNTYAQRIVHGSDLITK